jgi:hypothetical protein
MLTVHASSSCWQAWHLSGGGISAPPASDRLRRNARLPGLCKFVAGRGAASVCRFDLPVELLRSVEEADPAGGPPGARHPLQAWAEGVSAAASGRRPKPIQADGSAASLAAALEKNGWPVSAAEEVRVSVSLPGLFRQILIEPCGSSATRLSCELADISSWPQACRSAALLVAGAANDRLRLARFALVAVEQTEKLFLEVNLTPAPIPGVWLDAALEAMHAAIRLTARELTALRDPELAKWTLAATAA